VQDAASHFFAEAIHEATVHAKYGENHLHAEIASTGADNDNTKNDTKLKSEDIVSFHIPQNDSTYIFLENVLDKIHSLTLTKKICFIYISSPAPPPKSSLV
jgi:hypothetical protein